MRIVRGYAVLAPMALALSIGLPAAPAMADDPLDATMTRATDQTFDYEMTTREPGKDPRMLRFKVFIKGQSWRRIDFGSAW